VTRRFVVSGAFHVKETKEYPWPCEPMPGRRFVVESYDVLTRTAPGIYTKHNGLCQTNLRIPDEDVVPFDADVELEFI
jgi:hypothetical protein